MKKLLLGKKVGMLGLWNEQGEREALTVLEVGPCPVVQVKTPEKDGYSAVQVGYSEMKDSHTNKAEAGHQKAVKEKTGNYFHTLMEIRDYEGEVAVGDVLDNTMFAEGDNVFVQGVSKGKGFQGVVKRYGFGGGRKTHGSKFHRTTGSIGAGTDPSEVIKGKRMPGRMGGKAKTVINLKVVKIIPEENLILVKGSVPGRNGGNIVLYQK